MQGQGIQLKSICCIYILVLPVTEGGTRIIVVTHTINTLCTLIQHTNRATGKQGVGTGMGNENWSYIKAGAVNQ